MRVEAVEPSEGASRGAGMVSTPYALFPRPFQVRVDPGKFGRSGNILGEVGGSA